MVKVLHHVILTSIMKDPLEIAQRSLRTLDFIDFEYSTGEIKMSISTWKVILRFVCVCTLVCVLKVQVFNSLPSLNPGHEYSYTL